MFGMRIYAIYSFVWDNLIINYLIKLANKISIERNTAAQMKKKQSLYILCECCVSDQSPSRHTSIYQWCDANQFHWNPLVNSFYTIYSPEHIESFSHSMRIVCSCYCCLLLFLLLFVCLFWTRHGIVAQLSRANTWQVPSLKICGTVAQ